MTTPSDFQRAAPWRSVVTAPHHFAQASVEAREWRIIPTHIHAKLEIFVWGIAILRTSSALPLLSFFRESVCLESFD